MAICNVSDRVTAVGASDPDLAYFDRLMPTPYGTTYNSYLVVGDERTALIDPVQLDCVDQLLAHLAEAGVRRIDDILCLHAEQDHSGSIKVLTDRFPQARLVATAKTAELYETHLHIPRDHFHIVAEGEVLNLGGIGLECMPIPFAHWPDNTMFWLAEGDILFSSDLFGSHYAPTDFERPDPDLHLEEARAYYAEIMMPTRNQVARHVERVATLDPSVICSAHGPVWFDASRVIECYLEMLSPAVKPRVVMPLVSMHESTERMANVFVDALREEGIEVSVHRLDDAVRDLRDSMGKTVEDAVDAAAVILGVPTVLGGPHPSSAAMALMLNTFKPKNRYVGLIGSYGWGTQVEKRLYELMPLYRAERLDSLLVKGLPTSEDEAAIRAYARDLAAKIRALD